MSLKHTRFSVPVAFVICVATVASAQTTLTTLAHFDGQNGRTPHAGLLIDSAGYLYGTTYGGAPDLGGSSAYGSVFRIPISGGAVTTLANFSGSDGAQPDSALVVGHDGNLYGTTYNGGGSSQGTIYRLPKDVGNIVVMHSFFDYGGHPTGNLTVDPNFGDIRGTTSIGSTSGYGSVYVEPAGGGHPTLLGAFSGLGTSGRNPSGGLLPDNAGNLYGVTSTGGSNNVGAVYRIPFDGGNPVTIASFPSSRGTSPTGSLVSDGAGFLYGTARAGGLNDDGTVFRVKISTGAIATLATFDGANGRDPESGLLADAAGNLYGITQFGGANDDGTVFSIPAGGGPLTTLLSFDGSNGKYPISELVADSAGNLYGTTQEGGSESLGTVFKLSNTGFVVAPEPAYLSLLILLPFVLATRRRNPAQATSFRSQKTGGAAGGS